VEEGMSKTEKYTNDFLNISVTEESDHIRMHWSGKSIDRKPSIFITPILIKILKRSVEREKRMIMDFCDIEYMNSSTITPFTKILERAKEEGDSISIVYNNSKKWQELCFSALKIFETKDKRIQIKGKKVS